MDMPFIPDFSDYKARNKWIVEHAQYFTIVRRFNRRYERDEAFSFDEAVETANRVIRQVPDARLLIYAVAGGHDALTATVSSDGIRRHE